MAPIPLFLASWGTIRLFASSMHTDNSRTQVVHDLAQGDIHPVQDRGLRARRVQLDLLFDFFPGQDTPLNSFRQFKAAVDSGAVATFTHPVDGSYQASVGEFTYVIDENTVITAKAEFIAEEEIHAISPTGAATTGVSGESSTAQAADAVDAALANVLSAEEMAAFLEDDTSVTNDARTSTAAWSSGTDVPTRQILIDTARISDGVSGLIDSMDLELDLQLWQVYRSAIMLGDAVRSAAIAATSEVPSVFVMFVNSTTALLPLAARVYGGAQAFDRARQVVDLNDISTPGWLAPGYYLMPARNTAQRSPF